MAVPTMHFDATNSECRVITRRAGVLATFGHDLELAVGEYRIAVSGLDALDAGAARIEAEFAAGSVHVRAALQGDTPRPELLRARDQAEINRHIAEDVLHSARHPRIAFRSTRVTAQGSGYRIEGVLQLHGVERPLALAARRRDGRIEAEAVVHQPDFGIAPFKALAGALKVRPDVQVRISVPAPDAA